MSRNVRAHTDVVIAAINALPDDLVAYRQDQVPDPLPDLFAIVHVERRNYSPIRFDGTTDFTLWRATVINVGTTVREAQWAAEQVTQALDEAKIVVDDETFGPVQFELEQVPELDSGRYRGRTQWTY